MTGMFEPDQIVGAHRLLDVNDRLMHLAADDVGIDAHMFGTHTENHGTTGDKRRLRLITIQ
ncbi:hypothetical protein D3C71_2031340 [compost metagenome]